MNLRYTIERKITKGVLSLSIELYPDHKAILHFYDSLKVYEVDFLEYLTRFLAQDAYTDRHFDIYVKPTLHHSAFDFIIVEPNQKIYIIQTPESAEEYLKNKKATDYFFEQRLDSLSPTLKSNIQRSAQANETIKNAMIKQLFYTFEEELYLELREMKDPKDTLLSAKDFNQQTAILEEFFVHETKTSNRLTPTESREIKQTLNPNTTIEQYIPKNVPHEYLEKTVSHSQARQKFKGYAGHGKTILLAKRAINCSNRLRQEGKILMIAGNISKVDLLKDIVTAESGKSLQELGIVVTSYQQAVQPTEKYQALFIDDAHYLKTEWFRDLLDHYLVEMTEENDYEYVVMADADYTTKVPQIYGPFVTLKYNLERMTTLLNTSRDIFLDILNAN